MVLAEITVLLIQCLVVPIITELVKVTLKKLSSGKELKELEAGLGEIKSMVDLETMSLRRDPKVVIGSLRRLKGATEATESILGDRRTTGIAMGRSIAYLSGKTQLLPQVSESILPSVRSFVQGMEPNLQKENVNDEDPVRQTLRKLEGSVASLRRPAVEHRKGNALRRTVTEGLPGPVEPQRENDLRSTAEESPYGMSLREYVLSKQTDEPSSCGKSLREPVSRNPTEQPREGKSLRKPILDKLVEQPLEGKSLRKTVLSKPAEEPQEGKGKTLRKPVLSKPAEEPQEGKSLRQGKSHHKPAEELSEGKSLRRQPN
jgi:hypothetical protein